MKQFTRIGFAAAAATLALTTSSQPTNAITVTLAGSFQSELGCFGDWQPDCAITNLTYNGYDDVWQGLFDLPAGTFEYKVAINNAWDENYGANALPNGLNIVLNLAAPTTVKFYLDYKSKWATDNVNSRIVTAPGSFQSELGCNNDWNPSCLKSWLQDIDGDGIYTLVTYLPVGDYQALAAINQTWDQEVYGLNGILRTPGTDIPFSVTNNTSPINFSFDNATNILTIQQAQNPDGERVPEPTSCLAFLAFGTLGIASKLKRK